MRKPGSSPLSIPRGKFFFQLFPYGFKIQRVLTLLLLWQTIVEEKLDSSYTKGNSECRGILAYGQTGSGTSGSERRVTTRSPCVDGTFHRWNWSIVAGPLFFFFMYMLIVDGRFIYCNPFLFRDGHFHPFLIWFQVGLCFQCGTLSKDWELNQLLLLPVWVWMMLCNFFFPPRQSTEKWNALEVEVV